MELEYLTIDCKDFRTKGVWDFFKRFENAIKEGFVVRDLEDCTPREAPDLGMNPSVTLVKGVAPTEITAEEITSDEVTIEQVLRIIDSLTKKKDLLELAEKLQIKIPEDKKQPSAIAKYLKEIVSTNDE